MKSSNTKSHGDVSLDNSNNFHMHCMNNKTTSLGGVCSSSICSAFKLTKFHQIYIHKVEHLAWKLLHDESRM